MTTLELFETNTYIPLQTAPAGEGRLSTPENWYAEPFTKRTACRSPGQCGGNCDCGCPYNTMAELERLPLIEEIARIFPNEWLAFIISPDEDEDFEPVHGKLVAHSPDPDEIYDAVNTVLWNQHVYVYFNGDFETMKANYGANWAEEPESLRQRTFSGPKQVSEVAAALESPLPLPEKLMDLIYSALDQLYGEPKLNEAIRRLRLARVRAANAGASELFPLLDGTLDQLEAPLPRVNEAAWFLEEALAALEEEAD